MINDPLTYFTMDAADTSVATITDKGSGEKNGTLVGAPTSATGHIHDAIAFNGTSQCVSVATPSLVGNLSAATVAAWFHIPSNPSVNAVIFSETDNAGGGDKFNVFVSSTGLAKATAADAAENQVILASSSAYSGSEWHHVVFVRRSKSDHELWVDGVMVASDATTTIGTVSTNTVRIGCTNPAGTNSNWFPGSIDEVRVYDRALSAEEIAALYAYDGAVTSTWNGSAWDSWSPDYRVDAVVDGALTISAAFAAKSLTVNSGGITLNNGASVNVVGDILMQINGAPSITGAGTSSVTWGGSLKVASDPGDESVTGSWIVSSPGNTLTLSGNVDASNMRTWYGSMVKAGGGTVVGSGNIILSTGSQSGPLHAGVAGGMLTWTGNATSAAGVVALGSTSNGHLVFNGNVTLGAGSATCTANLFTVTWAGQIDHHGSVSSASTDAGSSLYCTEDSGIITQDGGTISLASGTVVSSTGMNAKISIAGSITVNGTNAIAFSNTYAGSPTWTITGMVSVSGTGAKVFNVTTGTPVIRMTGGISIGTGATMGTVPAGYTLSVYAGTAADGGSSTSPDNDTNAFFKLDDKGNKVPLAHDVGPTWASYKPAS